MKMKLLVIATLLWAGAAGAQPGRRNRCWIVPTGPAAHVDVNARRVAPRLGEALGQPVIVENSPARTA